MEEATKLCLLRVTLDANDGIDVLHAVITNSLNDTTSKSKHS